MKRKTKSILKELDNLIPSKCKHDIVNSRGNHIIESAINLLNLIEENFDEDEAQELQKRFFSSLRNKDPRRFERGVKKIKESKEQTDDK